MEIPLKITRVINFTKISKKKKKKALREIESEAKCHASKKICSDEDGRFWAQINAESPWRLLTRRQPDKSVGFIELGSKGVKDWSLVPRVRRGGSSARAMYTRNPHGNHGCHGNLTTTPPEEISPCRLISKLFLLLPTKLKKYINLIPCG